MIGHVYSESLLTVVTPPEMVQVLLFALQFILDALAIRRVSDQG